VALTSSETPYNARPLMHASHRVAMNTSILYARMAVTVFLSLYTTRITLHALGSNDFGIFNVVGGAIAMLAFLNAGMAASTQRFMSFAQGAGDLSNLKIIFNVSVILHVFLAVIILIVLECAGWALFHGILKIAPERIYAAWMVYQFSIISTLFSVISVPYDAVINARENMLLFAILGVAEAICKLIIAFVIMKTKSDRLVIYGALIAILSVILMLIRASYCHSKYVECTLAPRRLFELKLFKEMTKFAGWSFLGNASSLIAGYSQGIVLNVFFGTAINAAQGIANQVSGQLGALGTTMLGALNPIIGKSEGAGNRSMTLKAAMMGSKVSFFLLVPLAVPLSVEMPFILRLWLKNPPHYAVIFCQLLLLKNLVSQLFITLSATIFAVGNIRRYQVTSSFLNLAPIVLTYVLFSFGYPPYANYLVYIGYAFALGGLMLYFVTKDCKMSPLLYLQIVIIRCVLVLFAAMGGSLLPLFFLKEGLLRFVLVIGFDVVAYTAATWLVGFSKEERKEIAAHATNARMAIGSRLLSKALVAEPLKT